MFLNLPAQCVVFILLSSAAALKVGKGNVPFPQSQGDARPEFLFARRSPKNANVFLYGHFSVPGHLTLRDPVNFQYPTGYVLVSSQSKTLMDFTVEGKLTVQGGSYPGTYDDCVLKGQIEGIELRGVRLRTGLRSYIEFTRGIIKSPTLQCHSSNAAAQNYITDEGNRVLSNMHFQNSGVWLPSSILKKGESVFIHEHLPQYSFTRNSRSRYFNYNLAIVGVDGIYSGKAQSISVNTNDLNPGKVSVTGELSYSNRLWVRFAGQAQRRGELWDASGFATLLDAEATVIVEHEKIFQDSGSDQVIKLRSFTIRGRLKEGSVHIICEHETIRKYLESHIKRTFQNENGAIAFTNLS